MAAFSPAEAAENAATSTRAVQGTCAWMKVLSIMYGKPSTDPVRSRSGDAAAKRSAGGSASGHQRFSQASSSGAWRPLMLPKYPRGVRSMRLALACGAPHPEQRIHAAQGSCSGQKCSPQR